MTNFANDLGAWGDARDAVSYQAGAASRQTEVDSAKAATIAVQNELDNTKIADAKALAALQAVFDAYKLTHPDIVPPAAPEVFESVDFAQNDTGLLVKAANLVGKGVDKTIYQMKPNTSTKRAKVEALVKPATNPERLLRVGGTSQSDYITNKKVYDSLEIGNFTVRGTEQGHAYGGMNVGYSNGAKIHDINITGCPGFDAGPPGETFPIALWHADNAVVTNVNIDGRWDGKGPGPGVAATLMGHNYHKNTQHYNCTFQYAMAGFGIATWECTDEGYTDCNFWNNRKHINIERTFGGTFKFTRCDFKKASVPYVAQCSTDPIYGSAKIIFEDCTVDGDGILRVRTYQPASNNAQKDSDITCIQKGVDVTNDKSKFLIVHSG